MHHWTWEHCLRPLGRLVSPSFHLLPRQLFTEFGHIVLPFCLVTCASHREPELLLFVEKCHLEFALVASRSVAENGLLTFQWSVLLINQPGSGEGLCPWMAQSPHTQRGLCNCWCHWLSCWTPENSAIPVFWVLPAGSIQVCQDQGVVFTWIKAIPCNTGRLVLNLSRHQHFAQLPWKQFEGI